MSELDKLKKLTNEDLLDAYETAVRWHHYDPVASKTPRFTDVDLMREELKRRMSPDLEDEDEQEEE